MGDFVSHENMVRCCSKRFVICGMVDEECEVKILFPFCFRLMYKTAEDSVERLVHAFVGSVALWVVSSFCDFSDVE